MHIVHPRNFKKNKAVTMKPRVYIVRPELSPPRSAQWNDGVMCRSYYVVSYTAAVLNPPS